MLRWVLGALVLGVSTLYAQAPPPPPPGELQALKYFEGTWTMEADMKPSPLGPGGRMTGTETCEWFAGGLHLVCRSQGSGPMGKVSSMAIMSYDTSSKSYVYYAVSNMGPDPEHAKGSRSGNVWTYTSRVTMNNQTIDSTFTITEQSPTTYTMAWAMTSGGKTTTIMEGRAAKKT